MGLLKELGISQNLLGPDKEYGRCTSWKGGVCGRVRKEALQGRDKTRCGMTLISASLPKLMLVDLEEHSSPFTPRSNRWIAVIFIDKETALSLRES